MQPIPFHNHSEYSAIDGYSTIKEIVARALDIGAPAIGLSDHGVVTGHLEFDKVARKEGVKPLFGCELYHGVHLTNRPKEIKRDQAHLIVFAKTDEGLKNLWRMTDRAAQEDRFFHVGRNAWEDFETLHEGTIATSACVGGLVPQALMRGDYEPLNRYLNIWKDNFYIELPTYPGDVLMDDYDLDKPMLMMDVVKKLVQVAHERGIPLFLGDDGHYAHPDQFEMHDAYIAKKTKQDIYTDPEDRKMWHPPGALCIKDEETVRRALHYLPDDVVDEAIRNTVEVAESCDAHLPEVRRHLPVFIPDECPWVEKGKYDNADTLFLDLVTEGIERRYGPQVPEDVWAKAAYESEVFIDSGLTDYFLLAWDVFAFCDTHGIERGPGRGSSAGCIVAYALGITDVDPLPYNLVFERFWNPGRAKGFPDIDSDFEKSRRHEIKQYLTDRWGHDRVRSIGNVGRLKPLALIEGFGIAVGLTWDEIAELKAIIEKIPKLEIFGPDQIGWSEELDPGKVIYVMHPTEGYDHDTGDKIEKWIRGHEHREKAIEILSHLCNRVSQYGVHASGIVICDEDLPPIAPCRFAGSQNQRIPVTQFPMSDIDDLLLIKLDVLGLRTLDVLGDWRRTMKKKHGVDIEWNGLEWEDHAIEMWKLLDAGFSAGVFQVEDGLAKQVCRDYQPRSIEDLAIISSLIRPGPDTDEFMARRQGKKDITYRDNFLIEYLSETLGLFLYQEQVINYFKKLGYSLSDADAVRKILGKKQPEKWKAIHDGLDEWEGKGYATVAPAAGVENYEEIWKDIVQFGAYSFNKAHSVVYATISFRCLFAKYLMPDEWYAACIRNVDDSKRDEGYPRYVNEARRWGFSVLPPNVLDSTVQCEVTEPGEIHFGLAQVKGVKREAGEYFIKLRDEVGLDIESPDAFFEEMERLTQERATENKRRTKLGEPKLNGKSPKQMLRSNQIEALVTAGAWDSLGYRDDIDLATKQAGEKELLQVILTDNTQEAFDKHWEELKRCDTYAEALAPYEEDRTHKLPGVVVKVKNTRTKATGDAMGIITIAYEGDTIDFAVFPNKWQASKFMWRERTPVIVTLKYRDGKRGPSYSFESGKKL